MNEETEFKECFAELSHAVSSVFEKAAPSDDFTALRDDMMRIVADGSESALERILRSTNES